MRTNKLLSWIFIITFSITSVAYASEFTIEKHEDRTCSIVWYNGNAISVDIPSTIEGHTVTAIGDQAFRGCASLAIITIPDSVTHIGNEAFADCYSLAYITITDSVISIGDRAFYWCDSMPHHHHPQKRRIHRIWCFHGVPCTGKYHG